MSFVLGLEGIQEFEEHVKKISEYAFGHAIGTFQFFNPETASDKERSDFLAKCHEGFALAQEMIVDQLLKIQANIREYTSQLKDAKRKRDKESAYRCEIKIIHLTHRESVLRKIADAIAWQLWGLQRWNLRRLYIGKQMPYLDSSNITSIMDEVKQINKEPLSFGLITDITSFIQIGDILKVDRASDPPKIYLIEMKEGVMNEKAMEFLQMSGKIQCPRIPYFFAQEHGKKALEQAIRIIKQQMRAAQVQQFVRTGKGKDLYLDKEITMPDEVFEEKGYDEILVELVESCKSNGKANGTVDECLFVGVYDPMIYPAYWADFTNSLYLNFRRTSARKTPFERSEEMHMYETYQFLEETYPIYDLRCTLTIPLSSPIFLRWLPENAILNIIFGKMTVLLYLDYDKWFSRCKNFDMVGRWSTDEELGKYKADKGAFRVLGRIPIFEKKGQTLIMGDGTLTRIIDGTRPDSIIEMTSKSLEHIITSKPKRSPQKV